MDKFIDDLGTVRVVNGLVRIQTVRKIQTDGGEQRTQERGELILPMSAFLNLHSLVNRAVDQMVEQGVLTRKSDSETVIEDATPEAKTQSAAAGSKAVASQAKK